MINTREIAVEYRLSHWAEIMRERQESGKSIKAYCESVGLHQNVYHYWQRKLREAACQELLPTPGTNLLPQNTAPNGWALCNVGGSEAPSNSSLTLEIGKFKLTVRSGDSMELLASVCQTLVPIC